MAAHWEERPFIANLELRIGDGRQVWSFPITKRQAEACTTLETQGRFGRQNPKYEERTKRWLMMDLRRYRRHLGLPSLGPIIPIEKIRILDVSSRQLNLF